MPVFTKHILSGSTSGETIPVNATASPGTIVHTSGATATDDFDEIHLYLSSSHSADVTANLEFGSTSTEDLISLTLPTGAGPYQVSPGWVLTATTSVVRVYATATGLVTANGYVNRIS